MAASRGIDMDKHRRYSVKCTVNQIKQRTQEGEQQVAQEDAQKPAGDRQEKGPSYEESFARVEQLVKELESGELSLQQSIKKYEEAVKSMNRCYELLDAAQKKIEILLKDAEGRIQRQDFDAD